MTVFLNEWAEKSGEGVYVVASSSIINDEILRHVHYPTVKNAAPEVMITACLDKRDGFPNHMFLARHVVVGSPPQYHLPPGEQRVIGIIAETLLGTDGAHDHYKQIEVFDLDDEVQAIVLEKREAWSRDTRDALSAEFRAAYPDRETLMVNDIMPFVTRYKLGDECGEVRGVGEKGLFVHPGNTEPSKVVFDFGGAFNRLRFVATFDNLPALDNRPPEHAEVNLRITLGKGGARSFYVTRTAPVQVDLDISDATVVSIEVDSGEHGSDADWFLMQDISLD
jgi:hypothetical protein